MMSGVVKQNMLLLGKTLAERCVSIFSECRDVDSIVLVVRAEDIENATRLKDKYPKISTVVCGGAVRAESAAIGFSAVDARADFVAIHDAARCLITADAVSAVLSAAFEYGAATAASQVTDTLKMTDGDGVILSTVPRDNMYRSETPQVFKRDLYAEALKHNENKAGITDDNMLLEAIGVRVKCVNIGICNLKITTPDDFLLAEFLLERRGGC
jgi:2-C-methyl-D-erythritol 4-phosphate cytidylyltransferase